MSVLIIIIGCVLVIGAGSGVLSNRRLAVCKPVPLLAGELLPNATLATPGDTPDMPAGYSAGAPGVQLGRFALDGDGRSLHLMGIANYVQTPPVVVQPGQAYCFSGYAITDSEKGSPTRVRVAFHWFDDGGDPLGSATTRWQPVVLWQPEHPPEGWSHITAAFQAPAGASTLRIRIHPASDDRVYLDVLHVQRGGSAYLSPNSPEPAAETPSDLSTVQTTHAWPEGKRAAVSFSFDWETTMAGLIHSRSVGDPNASGDPVRRGLRMREGITTTLNLFRPYGIRATYYTAGYTFLLSNTTQTQFMGNPTYSWATRENRWLSDHWQTTPWFAPDPYGTVQSHPAWYFGDLVGRVQRAGHDIQSHTFSHFYGGFVPAQEWQEDLQTWNEVAAWRGVPAARSLAFPWSSSGGMSYASWDVLEAGGIRSLTRLSDQSQYNLFPLNEKGLIANPRCIPLPGHERLLACPDFYLTPDRTDLAIAQIDHAREVGGMIDIWGHTEEVVSKEQQAAWERVVRYAASHPDLWVAPLSEIAEYMNRIPGTSNK
jgi:peptidoglycan/xylan/chitin deacetylase (PgdA/CDA1 family)